MLFDEIPEGILSKSRQCLGALTAKTVEKYYNNTKQQTTCTVQAVCCVLVMQLYLLWFLQMSRFRGVLLLNIELFMLSNFQ